MTGAQLYLSHLWYLEVQNPGLLVLSINIHLINWKPCKAVFSLLPKAAMEKSTLEKPVKVSSAWCLEAELVPSFLGVGGA